MENLYRGSFISDHVLLNLLSELRKIDKMRDFLGILSRLCSEFIKLNKTRTQMLDSIYHMTLNLLESQEGCKDQKITFLA